MSRITYFLIPAFAIAAISGCSVGPDYLRPQAMPEIPSSFRESDGWKTATPGGSAVMQEKWWELYGDRQLDRLEEELLASSQSIRQAEAQFRQAQTLVRFAKAGYYPSLSVGAAANRSQKSQNNSSSSSTTTSRTTSTVPAWDLQLPVDLTWEIDLWGRIRRSVEASVAGAEASGDDLAAVRLSMQASLASTYFQLRGIDSQKILLDETVASYRKYLELTRNRYASGVAAKADVLQAETQLKTTEAQAIDLELQRAQLEHAIAVLVGKPASAFSIRQTPLTVPPPMIPAILPSELLERRPDIAASERRMAQANAQIGVARAAWFPTVKLSATAGLESSSFSNWISWPSRFWSMGPAVSQKLFDGGVRSAQDDQTRAAFDGTVASYRQNVLTAFQDVEDNLAALRILEAEARAQDEAVSAAVQTTAVVTNQYRAGTVSYLNIINAQATELSNRRTAISILSRRLVASVQLVKAIGGGWKKTEGR